METHRWEADLAGLLTEISSTERALLQLVADARQLVAAQQIHELHALSQRAERLAVHLRICHDRRAILQEQATQAAPDAADRLQRIGLDHWLVLLERLVETSQIMVRRVNAWRD